MTPAANELAAIRADALKRLAELQAVRQVLLPDADDSMVLSELLSVESAIRSAQRAMADKDHDVAAA